MLPSFIPAEMHRQEIHAREILLEELVKENTSLKRQNTKLKLKVMDNYRIDNAIKDDKNKTKKIIQKMRSNAISIITAERHKSACILSHAASRLEFCNQQDAIMSKLKNDIVDYNSEIVILKSDVQRLEITLELLKNELRSQYNIRSQLETSLENLIKKQQETLELHTSFFNHLPIHQAEKIIQQFCCPLCDVNVNNVSHETEVMRSIKWCPRCSNGFHGKCDSNVVIQSCPHCRLPMSEFNTYDDNKSNRRVAHPHASMESFEARLATLTMPDQDDVNNSSVNTSPSMHLH